MRQLVSDELVADARERTNLRQSRPGIEPCYAKRTMRYSITLGASLTV